MHTYVDRLNHFLGDHHNEVIVALALVVLAEAVIIWLWARRSATLRRRLAAALEAAGSAATHAAAALAVDALHPSEREPLAADEPAPAPVVPAWQPRLPVTAPVAVAPPPPAPVAAEPAAPVVAAPVVAAPVVAAPVVAAPVPVAALPPAVVAPVAAAPAPDPVGADSLSPVDTAAALRAAAEATATTHPAPTGIAGWAVEAAAQIGPAALEAPAGGHGGVAAWAEARPLEDRAPAWTWSTTAAAPAPGVRAGAPVNAEAGTVNLLLVEDDVNVAKLYRMLLESRGYNVRHAADGVEGLDAARRERPDLILLDVMMPRMNGISFLQALREDATLGAVPAVVLSNFREPRLVERAMALGALEYMVKAQTRPETLVGAIPHWLRGERVVTA
jgi:CheY-like chemotaxis protein